MQRMPDLESGSDTPVWLVSREPGDRCTGLDDLRAGCRRQRGLRDLAATRTVVYLCIGQG